MSNSVVIVLLFSTSNFIEQSWLVDLGRSSKKKKSSVCVYKKRYCIFNTILFAWISITNAVAFSFTSINGKKKINGCILSAGPLCPQLVLTLPRPQHPHRMSGCCIDTGEIHSQPCSSFCKTDHDQVTFIPPYQLKCLSLHHVTWLERAGNWVTIYSSRKYYKILRILWTPSLLWIKNTYGVEWGEIFTGNQDHWIQTYPTIATPNAVTSVTQTRASRGASFAHCLKCVCRSVTNIIGCEKELFFYCLFLFTHWDSSVSQHRHWLSCIYSPSFFLLFILCITCERVVTKLTLLGPCGGWRSTWLHLLE